MWFLIYIFEIFSVFVLPGGDIFDYIDNIELLPDVYIKPLFRIY